jgi:SAM-dependent methyltransferase
MHTTDLPIMIYKAAGSSNDEIDKLDLTASFENPSHWEDTISKAIVEAKSDSSLADLLKSIYLQEDREEAFQTFASSKHVQAIVSFVTRFGITPESAICDVGCGPGHLSYALLKSGFKNVSAMDPNGKWRTGTGYLKSIAGGQITIINDLREWRRISGRFDAIISQGTVHHWQQIPLVCIDLRRTMKPGSFWFVFSEYFANSPREFVRAIREHPTASRYGSYEWAYPPSVYVDLIQSVGLNLVAVVPYFYKNNELMPSMRSPPADLDLDELNMTVDEKLVALGGTVDFFWQEVDRFRRQAHGHRIFTEPQLLVFQRVGVDA